MNLEALQNPITIPLKYNFDKLIPPIKQYEEAINAYCEIVDPLKFNTYIGRIHTQEAQLNQANATIQTYAAQLSQAQQSINAMQVQLAQASRQIQEYQNLLKSLGINIESQNLRLFR